MKKKFLFFMVFLFLFLNIINGSENFEVIERRIEGNINWTLMEFEANGFAELDPNTTNIATNELLTLKKAEENGYSNLTTLIINMTFDSKTRIIDLIKEDSEINRNLFEFVQNAFKSDLKYIQNKRIIYFILPFLLKNTSIYSVLKLNRDYINEIENISIFPNSKEFTSLVIDCRGYMLNPALKPKILNPYRQAIITFDNVKWDVIEKKGFVNYICDISGLKALKDLIGDNPYIIPAIGSYGINNTDVIISEESIAFFFGNPKNFELIRNGKIILLIDKNK
ncbi:MAG TPA: hypothetical protein PLF21_04605 [Exilispira sp.]|nr:hypothetical protein [Exilispira sp.]